MLRKICCFCILELLFFFDIDIDTAFHFSKWKQIKLIGGIFIVSIHYKFIVFFWLIFFSYFIPQCQCQCVSEYLSNVKLKKSRTLNVIVVSQDSQHKIYGIKALSSPIIVDLLFLFLKELLYCCTIHGYKCVC